MKVHLIRIDLDPFDEGVAAFGGGMTPDTNPYPICSNQHSNWNEGWIYGSVL